MMIRMYLLGDDGTPYQITDEIEFMLRWPQQRVVLQQTVEGVEVSTIFLGHDHNWRRAFDPDATPVLFETMVFSDYGSSLQRRYATRAEALAGHHAIVADLHRHAERAQGEQHPGDPGEPCGGPGERRRRGDRQQ